jgi:hypothetical protein
MEQRTIRMPAGRSRSSAAVAVAGLLVVTGVLSGCDSQAETPGVSSSSPSVASASPSPSVPSPSPSASPSSAIPAAARVKSDKGAEAFVRYFFDQINASWMGPTPGLVGQVSDQNCQFCAEVEKTTLQLSRDGQRYRERPVSIGSVDPQSGAPANQVIFETVMTQHAANVVDESGRVVRTDEAGRGKSRIGITWTPSGWLMLGVEVA